MRPHRRQVAPDLVRTRVSQPVPNVWTLAFPGGVAGLQFEDHSSFLSDPFRQRSCRRNPIAAHFVRHQQHGRFSPARVRDIERSSNLDPWLTFKLDALTPPLRAARLLRYFHCWRGALGRNFQPAQFGQEFRYGALPFPGAKFVQNQLMEFSAVRFVVDMARRCDEKFVIGIEFHGLLMKITLTVLEPADHPLIDFFPSFQWSAMC